MGGEVERNQIIFLCWKGNPKNDSFTVWKEELVRAKVERKLPHETQFRNHWERFADYMTAHWRAKCFLNLKQKRSPKWFMMYPHPAQHCHQKPASCLVFPFSSDLCKSWVQVEFVSSYKNLTNVLLLSKHFLDRDLISELFIYLGSASCLLCKSTLMSVLF